jgi:hypothetical protein
MNRPPRPGDSIGILIRDPDRHTHALLSGPGWSRAFMSNDPRMLAALKLLGYETVAVTRVDGIEMFAKL